MSLSYCTIDTQQMSSRPRGHTFWHLVQKVPEPLLFLSISAQIFSVPSYEKKYKDIESYPSFFELRDF